MATMAMLACVLFIFTSHFLVNSQLLAPNGKCTDDGTECVFDFDVTYRNTMVLYNDDTGSGVPVYYDANSRTWRKRVLTRDNCGKNAQLTPEELDKVLTVDGTYGTAIAVNNQMPGPPIIVYKDTEVVVNVANKLLLEGITLHWHGITQKKTSWMDGVGMVSQCPINPGETFQYRFIADKVGTHWYHSHYGTQRTDGLYGAFIVLDVDDDDASSIISDTGNPTKRNSPEEENVNKENRMKRDQPSPDFVGEFILLLHDWMRPPTLDVNNNILWELQRFTPGYDNLRNCFYQTRQLDGTEIGVTPFVSGLINGKGRRYDASGNAMKSYIPVEEIEIVKKGTYRFRLISAAMMYPFRFSIDGHELHVFATDGNLIKTTTVDALIINSGERFDFYIETSAPVTNYWIRAETLETETILGTPISPGIVRGILRYRSADDMEPTSTRQTCSDNDRCLVMNCPFRYYPETAKTDCLSWSEVKAPKRRAAPAISNKYTFQEKFINFHFSGDTSLRSSVNGRRFIPPSTPPMILPGGDEKDYMTKCNDTECAQRHCDCTHYITLPSDAIVQIVLYNIRVGEGLSGTSHPVHFHGHHFHVLKSGFGTYDTTTGRFLDDTTDISCGDDIPRCNSGSWSNSSWSGDDIPGLNLVDPPIKDTVIVPVGGYVVIRYKTDNPGWWFVHCHIEIHQVEGMALMIKEGEEKQMTKPPKDFKTCGNFQWSREEFKEIISMGSKPSLNTLVFCLAVYIAFNAVTAI